MLLYVINMLIRAVEVEGFAKIDFGETHFFNGSIQRIDHMQRCHGLHALIALALSFQNHHRLYLHLSVVASSHP